MRTLLALALLFLAQQAHAQFPIFEKYYSDTNYLDVQSIAKDVDGGYIIAGSVILGNNYDAAIFKTDSAGQLLWTQTFGDVLSENGMDVKPVATGGYILAVQKKISSNNYHTVGVRINASGNIVWQHAYIGNGTEEVYQVQPTSDGGFLFSGQSNSYGPEGAQVIKTFSDGTIQWRKVYHGNRGAARCMAKEVPFGGYIMATRIRDSLTTDIDDVLVARLTTSGDTAWTTTFGGAGIEEVYDLECCADGGFLITGRTTSFGAGGEDIFITKLNAAGQIQWSRTYGGALAEMVLDVDQTLDGGFIIGGWTSSFGLGYNDQFIIRTNSIGDTLWTSTSGTINGGHFLSGIVEGDTGNVVTAGYAYTTPSSDYDVYLTSLDWNGSTGCNRVGTNALVTSPVMALSNLQVHIYNSTSISNTVFTRTNPTLTLTTACAGVGVEELQQNEVTIFPNPVVDILTVSFPQNSNRAYYIMDMLGKCIETGSCNDLQNTIDVHALGAGMYYLTVVDAEHQVVETVKVVKVD